MMKQKWLAERDRLLRQRDAIDNQIAGLERGIALMDEETHDSAPVAQGRGRVKAIIFDLLKEAGTTGLNAQSAVAMASRRGISLGKDSISSLLSRLKKDGVVQYDGDRYRLNEYARIHNSSSTGSVINLDDRLRA